MPSSYKEWWNEHYASLSLEMFDKEYWELMPDERVMLGDRMDTEASDWMSSRIDAAADRDR
jgi:hypothetical protein